jgi:hypothetical protein
MKAIVDRI